MNADFDGDGLDDVYAARYSTPEQTCDYIVYSSGIPTVCPEPHPHVSGDLQFQATTTGDFNGDGYDDLALGEPDIGAPRGFNATGQVQVYYGGPAGLTGDNYQRFDHQTPGIVGVSPRAFGFGSSVAAGDINGDGASDLVIGVPGDTANNVPFAGSVVVLFGSPQGLRTTDSIRFGQAYKGVPGSPSRYARFGQAVVAIDVTGDGYADVGVTDEGRSGYVSLMRGSAAGVDFTGATFVWTCTTSAPEDDLLSGGDVNGDGYADLIGAAPRVYPGGAILEMLGGPGGIAQSRSRAFTEDSPGVPRARQPDDFWGSSIAVGDVNGDGRDDLLAGAPGKTVSGVSEAGALIMLPGTAQGLTGHGSQEWSENSPGFCDVTQIHDWFGNAVMIGHFADPHRMDAIVSAPLDRGDSGSGAGLLTWITGGQTPAPGQCVSGDPGAELGWDMVSPRQNG